MKRHPALRDLSRDHHFVLRYAQTMRRAVSNPSGDTYVCELAQAFPEFFDSNLRHHFQEEQFVLNAYERRDPSGTEELRERAGHDHAAIRRLVTALRGCLDRPRSARRALRSLAAQLGDHARFEEEVVFQRVQETLTEPELSALGAEIRSSRRGWFSPDACLIPPSRHRPPNYFSQGKHSG